MQTKTKIILIISVLIILLFPIKYTNKTEGIKIYTSLTYKIIKWNTKELKKTSVYLFPFNFKSLDKLIENSIVEDVFLTTEKKVFSLNDTMINFMIVNNSNKNLYTHVSPTLEFKTNGEWILLEKNENALFCGNKDFINNSKHMSFLLSWYDNLLAGDYRISFNIYDTELARDALFIVSEEFTLQDEETSQIANSISCYKDDFEMSLNTDKLEYKSTQNINIWTTLKYLGDSNEVKIYHAGSAGSDTYFYYTITDGLSFLVETVSNMVAKTTNLKKNTVYYFPYQKSGSWETDAPNATFWENFYKEKDLYLPSGEYTITAKGGFSLDSHSSDNIDLICTLKIIVS